MACTCSRLDILHRGAREARVVGGKVRLTRELARGGMGSLWSAHHLELDVPVAVKFMAPALVGSAKARRRFAREARAAARLASSHVVQIYDYGIDEGAPYIVMELLRGEDLGARLARTRRLDLGEAAVVVRQATSALAR